MKTIKTLGEKAVARIEAASRVAKPAMDPNSKALLDRLAEAASKIVLRDVLLVPSNEHGKYAFSVKYTKPLKSGGHLWTLSVSAPKNVKLTEELDALRGWEGMPGSSEDPIEIDGCLFVLGDGDDSNAVYAMGNRASVWLRCWPDQRV